MDDVTTRAVSRLGEFHEIVQQEDTTRSGKTHPWRTQNTRAGANWLIVAGEGWVEQSCMASHRLIRAWDDVNWRDNVGCIPR